MKGFFTKNIGWKLGALAAAVAIWMMVASEPEMATFVSAPVEYKNLSTDLEINSDVVETVLLEVSGPTTELRGLPGSRPRYAVVLDMSRAGDGQHTFTIDEFSVRMPRGVRLVRAVPAQIRLNFEHGATRSIPVQVRFAGALPPDLQVLHAQPDPGQLAISGPATRVAQMASAETDPIHLTPVVGVAEYRVNAYVNDARLRFADTPQVTVKVTIGKK